MDRMKSNAECGMMNEKLFCFPIHHSAFIIHHFFFILSILSIPVNLFAGCNRKRKMIGYYFQSTQEMAGRLARRFCEGRERRALRPLGLSEP